ncbi:hypothetical protein Kfla_5787 [Kribbella flavida DSM 17836]|uniref:Serine/threonine protein kinase n=1 Tax=Kribbella flavida (strain DSM 17836 / JCM 10339 / NBRC 14399) TaxID=479435 RepID=D2PQ89_KRIFD|nr:hypothetical protein [Kribbella flavida]ADB34791.1 hypothetical protein Kfla_5787 [Kribbella flavida DSM 17836]
MRRTIALTTLWVATAAVAAGGATISLASTGSSGTEVLSRSAVDARLAAAQSKVGTSAGSGPVKGRTPNAPVNRRLDLPEATVTWKCVGEQTFLTVVTKPGYRAETKPYVTRADVVKGGKRHKLTTRGYAVRFTPSTLPATRRLFFCRDGVDSDAISVDGRAQQVDKMLSKHPRR